MGTTKDITGRGEEREALISWPIGGGLRGVIDEVTNQKPEREADKENKRC